VVSRTGVSSLREIAKIEASQSHMESLIRKGHNRFRCSDQSRRDDIRRPDRRTAERRVLLGAAIATLKSSEAHRLFPGNYGRVLTETKTTSDKKLTVRRD